MVVWLVFTPHLDLGGSRTTLLGGMVTFMLDRWLVFLFTSTVYLFSYLFSYQFFQLLSTTCLSRGSVRDCTLLMYTISEDIREFVQGYAHLRCISWDSNPPLPSIETTSYQSRHESCVLTTTPPPPRSKTVASISQILPKPQQVFLYPCCCCCYHHRCFCHLVVIIQPTNAAATWWSSSQLMPLPPPMVLPPLMLLPSGGHQAN